MTKMILVDNSGAGNCMYYAYAISLMYYLREQDTSIREKIFNRLKLTAPVKASLHQLLSEEFKYRAYTQNECKSIEKALGHACRLLAGHNTRREFMKDPMNSSTFTAAVYGIEACIKQHIAEEHAKFIILPGDNIQQGGDSCANSFKKAEIYHVCGMSKAMDTYVQKIVGDVVNEFNQQKTSALLRDTSDESIMSSITRQKTLEFLSQNHYQHLNEYIAHLQTNFMFAGEESLCCLHRAIMNEQYDMSKRPIYDPDIKLVIAHWGRCPGWINPETKEIIINHIGHHEHWTSIIPSRFIKKNQIVAVMEFKYELEKMTHRIEALPFEARRSDEKIEGCLLLLQRKIQQLDALTKNYTPRLMNAFIQDFSTIIENNLLESTLPEQQYISEKLSNFMHTLWYVIQVAFVKLITMFNPDLLDHLQVSKPVEQGMKMDIQKTQQLFGLFKPHEQMALLDKAAPAVTEEVSTTTRKRSQTF